jgi:hypothetical protein
VVEPLSERQWRVPPFALVAAMLLVTLFVAWEELRIGDRDAEIGDLRTQVAAGDRTIADLQARAGLSRGLVAQLQEQIDVLEQDIAAGVERLQLVTARRDILAERLSAVRLTQAKVRARLAATRAELDAIRAEVARLSSRLLALTGPRLADGRYLGVVNFVSTVGSQVGRPWTIGFVGVGERALVDGQGVMRVLSVGRDATVRFRSAIPDPPATYGFAEFEELFYSTAPAYAGVHSWDTGYILTVEGGRVVAITATR